MATPAYDDRTITDIGAYSVFSRNRLLPNWTSLLQLSRGVDKSRTPSDFGDAVGNTRQDMITWQNDIALGPDLLATAAGDGASSMYDTSDQGVSGSRATNSLAAVYQLRRGAHLASASVRNDDSTHVGSKTTGSLAYGYRLTDALRVNGSVGTSFRAPSYNELYYPKYGDADQPSRVGQECRSRRLLREGQRPGAAAVYRTRDRCDLIAAPGVADAHNIGAPRYNGNEALGARRRRWRIDAMAASRGPWTTPPTSTGCGARRACSTSVATATSGAGGGRRSLYCGERFDDTNTFAAPSWAATRCYGCTATARDGLVTLTRARKPPRRAVPADQRL